MTDRTIPIIIAWIDLIICAAIPWILVIAGIGMMALIGWLIHFICKRAGRNLGRRR